MVCYFLILFLFNFLHLLVIFQKRGQFGNPTTYFAKSWSDYKAGFNSNGELWLGLDLLHFYTSSGTWRLDVVLVDWNGNSYNARYDQFSVGTEASNYQLTLGSFDTSASTLGDSLTYHNNMPFGTMDVDNGPSTGCSACCCGGGGWWFNGCDTACLNGENSNGAGDSGIDWVLGSPGNAHYSWMTSELTITKTAN